MEEKKDVQLSQSNALTSSRYDFSKIEKNVIYHIIRKVRHDYVEGTMQRDLWNNMYVYINSADLAQITDEQHTKEARAALRSLRHKDIEMEDEEGNWLNVGFINYAKYNAKTKVYEVEVSKEIMPHLVELATCFTEYSLTVAISLKSKYSQRFYELCCQYRSRRTFFLEQSKLRQMLKLKDDEYKLNADFKRKIIDVAMKELKTSYDVGQCDLWFEMNQEGRGKDVRYNFKIHTKQDEAQEQELFGEVRKLAIYVYKRCKEIFKRDPKYCERVMQHLDFNPDKIQPVFDKLTKMEKDYKGADLAKLLRWVLREDFDIK